MNEKNELIRLTLKNLEAVESSYKILEEKDNHFKGQVDKFMEDKLEKIFPDLVKHYEFKDNDDLSFWSEKWVLPEDEGYAYYSINVILDENDSHWITCFVGKLGGLIGIGFNVANAMLNNLYKNSHTNLKKGKWWCSKLAEFYQQNEIALKNANFLFNGEQIYHPIQLDLELLSESYPDYIAGGVFQPLEDALNDIKSVHHIFDEFVKQLIGNTK